MILVILTGVAVVSVTVSIHAAGTSWWLSRLRDRSQSMAAEDTAGLFVLIQTALVLILLHVMEALVWALTFYSMVPKGFSSFGEAMYFSFTTFTTLGYGDVVIEGAWRLLTGIESLNGVLLIGWSTALSFAVIERIWNRD
ncbi:MAG: potassium channel family protein [Acidobacteriota bacterium]